MRNNFSTIILAIIFTSTLLCSCGSSKQDAILQGGAVYSEYEEDENDDDSIEIVVSDSINDPEVKKIYQIDKLNKEAHSMTKEEIEKLEKEIQELSKEFNKGKK